MLKGQVGQPRLTFWLFGRGGFGGQMRPPEESYQMECERIRQLLNDFADGELASPRREMVEEHIEACAVCREELSAIRRTIRLLRDFREVDEPADFVQQVRQRIEARERRSFLERVLPRPALTRVLVPVGCVLFAACGVWLVVKQASPPHERAGGRPAEVSSKPKQLARSYKYDEFRAEEPAERVSGSPKAEKEVIGGATTEGDEDADRLTDDSLLRRHTATGVETMGESRGREAAGETRTKLGAEKGYEGAGWHFLPAVPGAPHDRGGIEVAKEEAEAPGAVTMRDALRSRTEGAKASDRGLGESAGKAVEKHAEELGNASIRLARRPKEKAPAPAAAPLSLRSEEAPAPEEPKPAEAAKPQSAPAVGGAVALADQKPTGQGGLTYDNSAQTRVGDVQRDKDIAKEGIARQETQAAEKFAGPGVEGYLGQKIEAGKREDGLVTGFRREPSHDEKSAPESREYNSGFYSLSVQAPQPKEGETGQPESQAVNGTGFVNLFFGMLIDGSHEFVGWGEAPQLVLGVKDRQKALVEISKMVSDLGGTIESPAWERRAAAKGTGSAEGDFIIVKLKPAAYEQLLQKFAGRGEPRQVRGAELKLRESAEAKEAAAGQPDTVTLLIRLVVITEEPQPQQVPAK